MNLAYHLKLVYRNFINQRPYSFLNLIGLSIGLSIAFIALLYVTEETGWDKNDKNIYRLINKNSKGELSSINNAKLTNVFKEQIPEIKTNVHLLYGFITVNEISEHEICYYANPEIVDVFSFNSITGNLNTFKNDPKNVIISREFSLKHFKSINIINQTIEIKIEGRKETYTVVSVFEDFPRKSTIKPRIIVQSVNYRQYKTMLEPRSIGLKSGEAYFVLQDNTGVKPVIDKMNDVFGNLKLHFNETFILQPLDEIHLYSENIDGSQSGAITRVIAYSVIGILILIISLINFLSLYLAITKRRMREFTIRKINGLDKFGLVKNISFEFTCICLIPGLLAMFLLKLIIPLFNQYTQSNLVLDWYSNTPFLGYTIVLILVIGVLVTLYFYKYLSGHSAVEIMEKGDLKAKKQSWYKNSALTIQLMIVFVMLTFSFVYYKQLDFMINSGKGFSTENILLLNRMNWDSSSFEEEIITYPIITNIAKGAILPLYYSSTQDGINLKDKSSESFSIERFRVDCNYISLYNIALIQGRNFSKEIIGDTKGENIIINESAAKFLGGKKLIGKETNQGKIVGIVKDFKFQPLYKSLRPIFFRVPITHPKRRNPLKKHGGLLIKYKEGQKEKASELIYKVLAKYNVNTLTDRANYYHLIDKGSGNVLFDTNHYDSLVNDIYHKDIILQRAVLLLTLIAIAITILGLIGMSLFKTQQKTKEIGVRKVNGATIKEIMLMLNKDFVKWVLIAFVIACPISYYAMSKWLENFAYKTSLSWWVFALAGVFTLIIALLTVSWQTYRAATRNPVESLRDE